MIPALPLSLVSGARLGPYEVQTPLGAGGMGEVYRARDTRLGRDVAIKILPAAVTADPGRVQRFEQEARAAAALNHPNILAVFDIGEQDGLPYIVSELLEGQTLRERLNGGPLAVRKAIEYAVQIGRGLGAAHERGIVHRDLKPDNVFVTAEGYVKILDFGLAKLTEREQVAVAASALPTTPPNTVIGTVLGTIGYMSPEQVRGAPVDSRTDIFAFGALLYETLSGQRAFGGDTNIDVMTAILKEDPPDLPSADRQIPPGLQRIVDRCLEKSPTARFQTASDLCFALENLTSLSGPASVVGVPAQTTPARRGRGRAVAAAGSVAVVALAAVAGAAGYLLRPSAVPTVIRFTIDAPKDVAFAGGPAFAPAAALSPDGKAIAFMGLRGGVTTPILFVRPIDSFDARPLAGTDGAGFPFWSPDSASIGFFAQGKLKRIDLIGDHVQTLCDAPNGEGGTWGPDGTIVFAPNPTGPLSRVSASGGVPGTITALSAAERESSHRWPVFLPDGRHFLLVSQPGNVIRAGSLDSTESKRLLAADSRAEYAAGHLVFARGDTLFAQAFDVRKLETTADALPIVEGIRANALNARAAFSVSPSGSLVYRTGSGAAPVQLTWFDRAGQVLERVGGVKDYRAVDLSPDGTRLVVHLHDESVNGGNLWLFDLMRGTQTRFTFTATHEGAPHFSPDGTRIAFNSSVPGGPFDLYVKDAGGVTAPQLLFKSDANKAVRSWSPDGRMLVFDVDGPKTSSDIAILPLTGDRTPVMFLATAANEGQGELSPDGKFMAYTSNESGRNEVYVQTFPATGAKWLISTGGGVEPHWRRDGRELYYVSALPLRLMAVDLTTNPAKFDAGIPHPLFAAPTLSATGPGPATRTGSYAVSADGRKFVLSMQPETQYSNPLSVVVNWAAGLKK
jgi:eukaryotic-like serine/threonine-protein kinase